MRQIFSLVIALLTSLLLVQPAASAIETISSSAILSSSEYLNSSSTSTDTDPIHERILLYVVDAPEDSYFDSHQAEVSGESAEVLEAGKIFNQLAQDSKNADLEGRAYPAAFEWKEIYRYGNWCGLNHGAGTPIDALDEACKQHDLCYARPDFDNCACDDALRDDATRARTSVSFWGRINAEAIIAWTLHKNCT